MKYQVNLPNKAYECEIKIEVFQNQLQATETVRKDGKRVSSNGAEVDFPRHVEAQAAAAICCRERLSLKAISQL